MADQVSFTLKFPFKGGNGELIETLPIKRLKRKDVNAAHASSKDQAAVEEMLTAKMLGITLEDLGEFDIADSSTATEVLREMVSGGNGTGVLGRGTPAGAEASAV